MLFKSTILVLVAFLATAAADSAGYVLPSSGVASTTQFYLGPELSSGTACGVDALPNGESTSGKQGGGPGYLYVYSLSISPSLASLLWNRHFPGCHQPARIRSQPFTLWGRRPRRCLRSLLLDHARLLLRRSTQRQRPDLQDYR